MNEIPLSFPRESKKFWRGSGSSDAWGIKGLEGTTNPWSNAEIAARGFGGERGGSGREERMERERQLGHLRAALYIIELSGPDDLGHGRIIRILPETI